MSGCTSADDAMHSTGTAVAVPPTHAELLRFLDDFTSSAKAIQAHNVTRLQALLHWWPEFTLHAMLSIFCNLPTTLTNTAMTASSNLHHHYEYDNICEGATHTSRVAMEGHSYSLRQRQAAATVLRHLLRDQLTLTISRRHNKEEVAGKTRLFMRSNDNVSFLHELLTQLLPMTACFDAEQGTRPVVLCHAASDLIILLLRLALKRVHEATRHVQGIYTKEEEDESTTTTTNNMNSAVWPDFLHTLQTYLTQVLPYVTQQPSTQPGYASCDTLCATSPLVNVTLIRAAQAALLGLARLLRTLCEDKEVRQGIVEEEQNTAAQAEGVVRLTELLRHMLHCLSTSLTTYSNNTITTPSVGVASPALNTSTAEYYYNHNTTSTSSNSNVSECPAGWVEEYLCGLAESVLGACTAYLDEEENTLRVIVVKDAKGTQKPRSVALPMSTPSVSATNEEEEEQRHMPATTTTATEVTSGQSQRYTTTTTTTTTSVRRFLHALHDTLVHVLLPFTQMCLQAGKHEMAGAVLGAGCEAMRAFLTYVPHDHYDSNASCTQGRQTRRAYEVKGNAFMTHHQCSTPMNDVNAQHKREEEEDVERARAQVTLLQVALPVVLQLWQVSTSGSNRVVEVQPSCHTALPRVTSAHTTHAPLQQQQQHSNYEDEEDDALVSHPNREKAVQASLLCLTAIVPYLTEEALTCVMAEWVPTALSALHGLSCLSPRQLARLAKVESYNNNNNNNNNSNSNGLSAYTVSDVNGTRAACQAVPQGAVQYDTQQIDKEEEEEDFPIHVVEGKRGRHGRKAMAAVTRYTLSAGNGLYEEEDNNSEEEEDVVVDECDGLHCLSATQHARRQSVNWLLNALLSNAALAELTRHTLLQCSYTVLCEASQYILTQAEGTTSDIPTHQYEDIYVSHVTLEAAMMMLNECAEAMLRLSPTTSTTSTPASRTLYTITSSSSNGVTTMSSEALLSAITTAVMQLLNAYLQFLTGTTITTTSKKGCGVLPDYLGVPCVRWLTRLTLTASRVATHSNNHSSSDSPVEALSVALLAAVNGLPSLTSALVTLLQYEQRSAMQVEVIHGVEALMVNYLQQHHHSACEGGRNEEEGNDEKDDEGNAQSVGVGSELETESDSDDEGEEGDEATRCVTAQTGPLPSSSHTPNAQHTTPFTTITRSSSSEATSLAVLQECLVKMLWCLPRLGPAGRAALYALLAAVVPEWPTSSLLSNITSSSSGTVGPQTTTVSHLPSSLLCVLEALATQYNGVVSKTPGSLRAAASRIAEMAALLNCLCEVVPHVIMEEEVRGDIVMQSALPWLVQVSTREIAQYLFHDIHRANNTTSGSVPIDATIQVSSAATLVQSDAAYTKAGLSREEMCMLAVDLLGACCEALLDRQQLTLDTLLLLYTTTTTNSTSRSETRSKAFYEALATTPHGMMCDEVNTQSTSCAMPLWDAVLYIISSAFGMTPVVLHEGYHQCGVMMPSSLLQQQHAHCPPSNCANTVVVGGSMTMEERMQRMDFTTAVVGPGLRRACFSLLYDMVYLRTTFSSSNSSDSDETMMLVRWMSNVASCCVYELNGDDSSAYAIQADNKDTSVASAAMLCLAEVLHRCCVHGYDVQVILGSDGRGHKAGCYRECMRDNNNIGCASNSRDSRDQLLLQQQQQHNSYYVPHDAVSTPVMHTIDTMSVSLAAIKRYRRLYDILNRRYCPTSEEEKAHINSASHSVEVTERRNALLLITALYAFMVYVMEAVTSECNMPHTNTNSGGEENAWCCVSESDTRVFLHTVVPTARQLFTTDALNNNNNSDDMSSAPTVSVNGMDYETMQVWWNVGFALTHAYQHHQQQQQQQHCHLCNDAHGRHRMMLQDIHSMWNESAVVQQLKQLCLVVYRYGDVGSTITTTTASTNLFTLWRPLARHVCAYDEAGGMGWLSAAERATLSQ